MNEEKKNDGLKAADEAEGMEGKGEYYEAAEKYEEAGRMFKECKRDDLFARCIVAQYASLVKYDCAGRRIEDLTYNLSENFLEKIEIELNKTSLDDFTKYDTLISAYREIEKIFDEANMQEKADEVYFERTKLKPKYYWSRMRKRNKSKNEKTNRQKKSRWKILSDNIIDIFNSVMSRLFHLYCGYGERPFRAALISLGFIFLFSLIFCCFGLIDHASSPKDKLLGWPQAFYFSIVTFTTLGYGDILPQNWIGQVLVAFEVLLGYFMLGALVAIIIRKITRW
jgi:tetratricopeptide (TPR) repeat protein